ncbi:LysR family transcriptional regulator [Sporosarcina highlanderae]|uniref:LysR family transcriptional regulator n=1 Tax=Sporosarcina highlanderae TaxID=3035916 RepID=A0ABT8JSL1_9BACL|nr:LysR family transcriptional regulator [Sporosarcina highlanderae]MDN4608100.1 LysR family transcriptional regulator [Sporosarcina highlanderae]
MDERDWLIIHTLYQEKNITNTGKAMFISQPTLTKRLQQIETKLGAKIVDRGVKGVQFTPEGEYLAKRATELLDTFREIKEDVDNFNHYIAGTLRLGVSNFISKYLLPNWLADFEKQFPDVEFQVETGYSKQINQLAFNQDIHIGFIRGNYNWPGEKELLFEESLCIASIHPIDLENLPNLPRIDYQTDTLYKHLTDNWWAERYSQPPLVKVTVDRGDTCKEMVLSGLGYAILPSLFLMDTPHVYQSPLQTKDGHPLTQKTWMIYHKESEKLNVVKAFVDFIKRAPFV